MGSAVRMLIVDDERHVRTSLAAWFRDEGFDVETAASGKEALLQLGDRAADILLVDIKMPGMDGIELQQRVRKLAPDATVIIMTAHAAVETAIQALKDGAYDYITKPFDPEDVSRLVRKAAERYSLLSENRTLRERLEAAEPRLVASKGSPMDAVVEQINQVAVTDTSVLITGESGTGKEIIARLIHARSQRRFGPMVVVNCGALNEGVLESELFGHEKGAFTGAAGRRRGKIELANEGTLFLDEVGDIPAKVQVDLLRVLQEKSVVRVGGNMSLSVDFRLVAATHRDLEAEMQQERFRQDFYFRINVLNIEVPALRDRPADIPLLAEHFLQQFTQQMNRRIAGFTDEALGGLCSYRWPGNVRELQNAIERGVVLCRGGKLGVQHFPFLSAPAPDDQSLSSMEAAHVRRVLAAQGYNISHTAAALGIDRATLYAKLKKYKIERPT
ncbi:MAG: sigma-54-dependent Fis family transcriptional regulator [Deltaproteobacteria bacterium]|nr:sigma-54-dependent Fis family transcriptional regulator [Deltaproteobacteria bacterium]